MLKKRVPLVLLPISILCALSFAWWCLNEVPYTPKPPPTPTLTVEQIKAIASDDVSYDSLARNTEAYTGELVHYEGRVVQVLELNFLGLNPSSYALRVKVTKGVFGLWDDPIWINYEGPRILEDDIVRIWGRVDGRRSYTAILGQQIIIPEITALVLELVSP